MSLHGRSADGDGQVRGTDWLDGVHAEGLDRTGLRRRRRREGGEGGERRRAEKAEDQTSHVDLQVVTPEWRPRISRAKAELITEIWPGISTDLLAYLRGRRVRADEAEDIVQEVAARLLAKPVRFSTADELWPWAVTVAHNLAADRWRSEQRVAFVLDRLDAPDRLDVSAQAEDRVVLAAVQGALS